MRVYYDQDADVNLIKSKKVVMVSGNLTHEILSNGILKIEGLYRAEKQK